MVAELEGMAAKLNFYAIESCRLSSEQEAVNNFRLMYETCVVQIASIIDVIIEKGEKRSRF